MTRQLFICIIFPVLTTVRIFGQTEAAVSDTRDKESFKKLTEGVIKSEIAFFNINGSFKTKTDSFPKTALNEIPLVDCSDSFATLSGNGLTVIISSSKFDTVGHKLTYDLRQSFLTRIDNKPFWGTDGDIPKEKIESVIIQNGKQKFILPDSVIAGLYEPNFCPIVNSSGQTTYAYCKVFQSLDKKRVYIYMLNSDGAGGYELTWITQDNKYVGRVVDYGF